MKELTIKVKKLTENAVIPFYANRMKLKDIDKSEISSILDSCENIDMEKSIPMDGGMDLTATSLSYMRKFDCYVYGTGLAFNIGAGRKLHAIPRSSNRKTDCYIANHIVLLDTMYSNELFICFKNRTSIEERLRLEYLERKTDILAGLLGVAPGESSKPFARDELIKLEEWYKNALEKGDEDLKYAPYNVGERIAQMFVQEFEFVDFIEVDELVEYDRDGFGSTGA